MSSATLTILGWTIWLMSGAALAVAWRLDRTLRTLIPRVTEERWRQELIRDIYRFRPEFAAFEALDAAVIPIRWRRSYHTPRGAALVDRFYFAVAIAAGLFVLAVNILALV